MRFPLLLLVYLVLGGGGRLFAQGPALDPPLVKGLAAQVVAAADDAGREAVLAAAPAALREDPHLPHALNRAYGPLIYAGEYDRAASLSRFSERFAQARGNLSEAGVAQWYMANIEGSRGDNVAALAKFEACQKLFASLGEKEHLAGVLSGAGIIHLQLGDFRLALAELRRAETIYREVDYKEGIISAVNSIGNVFMDQGLAERALENWRRALALAGNDESWQIYLFHNIATAYSARGDAARAIELLEKSAALAEKQKDQPRLATDLQELGSLNARSGHRDLAETQLRRALQLGEEQGDKRRQTGALTALGDLLRLRQREGGGGGQQGGGVDLDFDDKSRREALGLAERASALAREIGEPAYLWRSRTLAGQLARSLGHPREARAAFEESIAAIEDARGHLAGDDEGAALFLADKMDPYQGLVALLVDEKKPLEALAMAERAKARVLVEILRSPRVDPARQMTAAERAAAAGFAAAVTGLNRQVTAARGAGDPAKLAALETSLAAARQARDAAEEDFFIAHPELRNRQAPRNAGAALSPAALGGLLAEGRTALLEYVAGEEESFVFTVTAGKAGPEVQAVRLPLGRVALAAQAGEFRAALASRSLGWQAGARALGEALLGPAWGACKTAQRLVIVPDGPLWELPFQALAAGGDQGDPAIHTLWEARPVSFAPSLTFLAQTPAAPTMDHPARLLAVGNPGGKAADPKGAGGGESGASVLMDDESAPLPEAGRQVEALGKLYGAERSTVLLGAAAHEDAFKKLAGEYDILHLATHGFLNDTAPMYSRLLMSQADLSPEEDGLLEAWEWLPLKLHARLAVLSACETGRGKIGAGEGVLGLSWALFSAGCRASIVSQWKVDSASTTELMIGLHRRLLAGEEVADALREAGLELAKDPRYKHPFYWAPFVVLGAEEGSRFKVQGPKKF